MATASLFDEAVRPAFGFLADIPKGFVVEAWKQAHKSARGYGWQRLSPRFNFEHIRASQVQLLSEAIPDFPSPLAELLIRFRHERTDDLLRLLTEPGTPKDERVSAGLTWLRLHGVNVVTLEIKEVTELLNPVPR